MIKVTNDIKKKKSQKYGTSQDELPLKVKSSAGNAIITVNIKNDNTDL